MGYRAVSRIQCSYIRLYWNCVGLKKVGNGLLYLLQFLSSCFNTLQDWYPPVSVFRQLGIRTRREIEVEKYSLKALRGDFDEISSQDSNINRAREAIKESRST